MARSDSLPSRWLVVACVFTCGGAGSACSESSTGCRTSDDCDSGRVCNILSRQCVRDYDEADADELEFLGEFGCTVNSSRVGHDSDVTGRLDGVITPMVSTVQCYMADDALRIQLVGVGPSQSAQTVRQRYAMNIDVPVSGSVDRSFDLERDFLGGLAADEFSVVLARVDEVAGELGDWVALGSSGSLSLSGAALDGEVVRGALHVQLVPVGTGVVGDQCIDHDACNLNIELGCFPGVGCSKGCDTQGDCSKTASVCTTVYPETPEFEAVKLCLRPCQVDVDCASPHHCANIGNDYGVCGPAELIGPADENRLGSRCTAPEECGDAQFCAFFADASEGVCTSSCDDGECGPYLDLVPVCLETDSSSFCAPNCQTSRDCPEDLECVADLGACLPPEVLASP